MQTSQYTAESFWQLYLSLPENTREEVMKKFVFTSDSYEDVLDSILADERKKGTFTSWEAVQAERKTRKAA